MTGYRVYRSTSSGRETFLVSSASTRYTDAGTAKGAVYFYVVTAVNAVGEGPRSNEARATAK